MYGEDGRVVAKIDMGWEALKIGVQYDGRHHQSDRVQYVRDRQVDRALEALGWTIIRVIADRVVDPRLAGGVNRRAGFTPGTADRRNGCVG